MRNDKAIREEVANGVLHAVDNVCMSTDDRTVQMYLSRRAA